jgi:hypothetical protein
MSLIWRSKLNGRASTSLPSWTTHISPPFSTPGRCSPSWRLAPSACTSRVMCSTSRHGLRPFWRELRPVWTGSRQVGSSSDRAGRHLRGRGGRRQRGAHRTAPEAVQALSEAIDIIRGIWNAKDVHALTVEGTHYQVQGVARGPEPVHNIGIWVPAGGPRMRRLVGQKADGWIAGGAWIISGVDSEVGRGNEAIDAAAVSVGRNPHEIRRIWDFEASFGRSRASQRASSHAPSRTSRCYLR